jgi:hypothetical protein
MPEEDRSPGVTEDEMADRALDRVAAAYGVRRHRRGACARERIGLAWCFLGMVLHVTVWMLGFTILVFGVL